MLNLRLWQNGRFVRFFLGSTISITGNWFNTVAIAVLTFRLTGQVSSVAVTIAALVLPRVLLSPIGGALADRFERRGLLITFDCLRAVVALLPLLVHDAGSLWLAYVAVLLLQTGTCIYNPAQGAYIPNLVPDELLEAANAAYATMLDIGAFAGPTLAALILGLWGPAAAFSGNALSFAISAGLLLTLPRSTRGAIRAISPRAVFRGYASIVRRYPRIAALYLCYVAVAVPTFFFQATMVVYAGTLGQPTTFVGMLYAAAGLGGTAGGLIMGQYLRCLSYATTVTIFALSVPLMGALALIHQAALALAVLACSVGAGTTGDLLFITSVQRHVASEERGRAFGMWAWCVAIGQLIGAGLGIVVTTQTAVPVLLWISLAVFPIVLVGVLLSISAKQSVETAPVVAAMEGTP